MSTDSRADFINRFKGKKRDADGDFDGDRFEFGGGVMKPSKVPGHKAGPNGSFPTGDPKHARLAIGAATHSFNAGHISRATENRIKADARSRLGRGGRRGS